MTPGRDYIGLGVGALVFDSKGKVFLARRGTAARNEREKWEFPGGMVRFGEPLESAILREFHEEFGMKIRTVRLLGVFDHLIPLERQHWVSATFIAHHIAGEPKILEPDKCSEIGWYSMSNLPTPLSTLTRDNVRAYMQRAS